MDSETLGSDKVIGNVVCKASGLCINGGLDDWWQIQYEGKNVGKIHMKCAWHPAGQ